MRIVDIAFATAHVDQADRLAAWRELVNRVFLPLAITPLPAAGREGEFGASVTGSDWGELRVWQVTATPMSAVRTVHHIESSVQDDYLLALHISGTATGAQDDRQLSLGPGDFALFDPTRPYAICRSACPNGCRSLWSCRNAPLPHRSGADGPGHRSPGR